MINEFWTSKMRHRPDLDPALILDDNNGDIDIDASRAANEHFHDTTGPEELSDVLRRRGAFAPSLMERKKRVVWGVKFYEDGDGDRFYYHRDYVGCINIRSAFLGVALHNSRPYRLRNPHVANNNANANANNNNVN